MRLKTTLGRMLVVAAAVVAAGMLGATFQVSAREQAPEPPTLPLPLRLTTWAVSMSNIATGRNIAGVHWRSDAVESYKLGEAVAIAILKDHAITFNEGGSFQFTKFDGTPITIVVSVKLMPSAGFMPLWNMWWPHTIQERNAMAQIENTMAR